MPLVAGAAALAWVAAACGGSTEADLQEGDASPGTDAQQEAGEEGGADDASQPEASDDALPDQAAPDQAMPDQAVPDQSVPDTVTPDQAVPDVVSEPDGIKCGATTCAVGQVCCAAVSDAGASMVCADQCEDGGAPMTCDGPEDCAGQTCCSKISTGAGTPPNCPITAAGATCQATCELQIPMGCPADGQASLCHTNADCTDPTADRCCPISQGGLSASFCVSDMVAQLMGCN